MKSGLSQSKIAPREGPGVNCCFFGQTCAFLDKLSDKRRCDLRVDEYFTKEGAIEHLDLIVTGVPRAGRDPEPTSAPTSTPPTRIAERQPEGVALRVSTTLGERDLYMKHHPHPTPPPDTSEPAQRHYVRATIAPGSEADPGAVAEGSFTASSDGPVMMSRRLPASCSAKSPEAGASGGHSPRSTKQKGRHRRRPSPRVPSGLPAPAPEGAGSRDAMTKITDVHIDRLMPCRASRTSLR